MTITEIAKAIEAGDRPMWGDLVGALFDIAGTVPGHWATVLTYVAEEIEVDNLPAI